MKDGSISILGNRCRVNVGFLMGEGVEKIQKYMGGLDMHARVLTLKGRKDDLGIRIERGYEV
jgi:hypothetical protein